METINIHKAKTNLSSIIKRVLKGESIIIARNGKPLVRLQKIEKKKKRVAGRLKGKIWVASDFDRMPKELMQYFQ